MKFLSLVFREKKYLPFIALIVILLIVQAYCELNLPRYMSDIVDVGIMRGGVETPVASTGAGQAAGGAAAAATDGTEAGDTATGSESDGEMSEADKAAALTVQMNYMWRMLGIMLKYTLVACGAAVAVGLLASLMSAGLGRKLRRESFTQIMDYSNTEMDMFSPASLITRSTNDIQQIQMAMVFFLRLVLYAPAMAVGGIIMVSETDTGLSWVIVVAILILAGVIGVLLGLTMPKFQKMQGLIDGVNLVSREVLTGLPVIRAFNREKFEKDRFDVASNALFKNQLFTNRAMSMFMPIVFFIMNIIMIGIVWFGGQGVDAGNLEVGGLMAFISYTMFIVMAFMMLSMVTIMLPRANVAAGRVLEVINTECSIKDKPEAELKYEDKDFSGRVAFEGVGFRYHDADEDTLADITFTAEPGKTTAIIGGTGSGKSTLINLIPRLFDVTEGCITIDGVDVRDLSQKKLRSLIGVVPQKGMLFAGTIGSNIKYSGEGVTDEAMEKAAEIAQAAGFIDEKEGEYESEISQGGSNVSGGQRQRLAIARAVAKNPKIFIFDDSFSALDYKTDSNLRKALSKNLGDATVLIVAQRIATILRADKIIVVDDGRIVSEGTHKDLLERCAVYREIAASQLSEEELSA